MTAAAPGFRPDHRIVVRHPRFDMSQLPRDWLGGNRWLTHSGNAGHVFIPLGEDFFVDSVKVFRDDLDDGDLRGEVRAFIGQESVHRRAHAALWDRLRADGVPVDRFARVIATIRSLEDHLPATFRLSVTAALEHYTAAFGSAFLTEDLHEAVPDEMARLLAWHGLEELEHRAVAFDVFEVVDGRYSMRLAGFVFATGLLVVVPTIGSVMFTVSDLRAGRPAGPGSGGAESTALPVTSTATLAGMSARLLRRMGAHVVQYLRPGFHPGQMEEPPEMAQWAARSGDRDPV
jgi:predicted metal-dependent hydrolase